MIKQIILGWGAPKFKEQFPELPDHVAEHFQKDSEAMLRLRIRGYVTDSQRDAITKKLFKEISKAIAKATRPTGGSDEH
ncbi:hypothetical protein WH297_05870 [Ochrobactrum vermis]|uniref:Uncharacterized protein n=1 Tax=Ochrobactrum vermis TaxID=1827297 RepID=A0ABU8PAI4_9HYPH|nr:hypothetical protein [Ochrobactrum vermis]PQZ29760.1 hypothetical protein CQZ93_06005 [Ochrobactrum vermis]